MTFPGEHYEIRTTNSAETSQYEVQYVSVETDGERLLRLSHEAADLAGSCFEAGDPFERGVLYALLSDLYWMLARVSVTISVANQQFAGIT